jgi:hypothetical protein
MNTDSEAYPVFYPNVPVDSLTINTPQHPKNKVTDTETDHLNLGPTFRISGATSALHICLHGMHKYNLMFIKESNYILGVWQVLVTDTNLLMCTNYNTHSTQSQIPFLIISF